MARFGFLTYLLGGKYNDFARALWRAMDMSGAVKNIIAGLVAFLLLDPYVSSFPWLHFKRAMLKKEVQRNITRGIENDRLVLLRFSKEEAETLLRWEHSREFEYKGQMYDVVQAWTVDNTVYYRCWRDREETKLNNRFRELAERAVAGVLKIGQRADPWSRSSTVLFPASADKEKILTPALFPQSVWAFADSYSSIVIQPPKPPPRRA
jgi:hypothetical protein